MLILDELINLNIVLPERTVLLNIETTGLSPHYAFIYMISIGWQEQSHWHFQYMSAESRMDERQLMYTFHRHLSDFDSILTFGGHSFSWRFMNDRWTDYAEDDQPLFAGIALHDIQKNIVPYKKAFGLSDLQKSTLEKFIGYSRQSSSTGKELMSVYMEWERNHDAKLLDILITHNRDDLISLLCLNSLSAYISFWHGKYDEILSWQLHEKVCRFQLKLHTTVPNSLCYKTDHASVTLEECHATLDIPVYEGRLKYFLPGPVKDYYYLPAEDQAIHRSVAGFVDRSHRQKATAATCYTHMDGIFLPTGSTSLQPHFQKNYRDKEYYILYDPENWQKQPEILKQYISSCIKELPQ